MQSEGLRLCCVVMLSNELESECIKLLIIRLLLAPRSVMSLLPNLD